MKDITIAAPFVEQSLLGARAAGYDVDRLLKQVNISPALLQRPLARVSQDVFVQLHQNLMHLMDDETLGLSNHPLRIGSFALIARSTLHEASLLDAAHCCARSSNLLGGGLVHYLQQQGSLLIYGLRRTEALQVRSNYVLESTAITVHRFLCWLSRVRIPLVRVDLDYPPPSWASEYRNLFYGAPVRFQQSEIRLVMNLKDLDVPVRQNLNELEAYVRRAPEDIFTPLASSRTSYLANKIILQYFAAGKGMPRADQVASELDLSEQSFWRRLHREGMDFTQIKTRVRRDVAISLLSQADLSIENIAETVGYSESSAFIRAFKSWTGMTPNAYRKL